MKKISCLKRNLNKKELKDAIQKYGDPDDYSRNCFKDDGKDRGRNGKSVISKLA